MVNQTVYDRLQQVAGAESLTTYAEVGALVGLDMENPSDRNELAALLDEINQYEAKYSRPLLSSVVVHAGEDNMPGAGFFDCARGLGKLASHDRLDEIEFWVKEVRRVHEHWSKRHE